MNIAINAHLDGDSSTRRLCTFRLGDLLLGTDILQVEEVVREREITPVPLADATMAGVLNLRGRILSVIDLRSKLGLDPATVTGDGVTGPHLVVHSEWGSLSLLIDGLQGVVDVSEQMREATPSHLPSVPRDSVLAVYRLDAQLLLEVDLRRICDPQLSPVSTTLTEIS